MENECEALPGVAYPRVRDNRSTLNTKTGYDDDDDDDDVLVYPDSREIRAVKRGCMCLFTGFVHSVATVAFRYHLQVL